MDPETLLVDGVLTDSMAIPPGVDRWLREIERDARRLCSELEGAASKPFVVARLDEVRRALDAFLEDKGASPLHRLLRRPLSQLARGMAPHRSFTSYTDGLFHDAEGVLETQAAIEALRQERARVDAEYRARMPYFTRMLLARARVEDSELRRVRRPADVRLLRRRLFGAETELIRLAQHLPASAAAPQIIARREAPGEISAGELWAALQLRLRERRSRVRLHERTGSIRGLQARQLRALGRAGGWNSTAQTPAQTSAEHLADQSLGRNSRSVAAWEDGRLWSALLAAAEAARFGQDRHGWQPRVGSAAPAAGEGRTDDPTLRAVPFASDFVYLSATLESPVIVWSRAVLEGEQLECRVFGGPDAAVPVEWAQGDIAPLFDGVSADGEPAWYDTQRRAKLDVLCAYHDGWFARVSARGEVRRLDTPVWQHGDNTAGAVRVLISGRDRPGPPVMVGGVTTPAQTFLGLRTREVVVPWLDCTLAWLRSPQTAGGEEAVKRERAALHDLRSARPHAAIECLGEGQLEGEAKAGFLYVPPLALPTAESPLLRDWITEDRLAFLRALSNTLLTTHAAEYALGVYHPQMFAFGVEADIPGVGLQPRVILTTAPAAVRFGRAFPVPMMTIRSAPLYERLRYQGFTPAVASGDVALPESDAAAFALLLLDLLAPPMRASGEPMTGWSDLLAHLNENISAFAEPELARELVRGLPPAGNGSAVLAVAHAIAAAKAPG